ncbi:MAG: hypothetical protein ACREIQ_02265 [Nitrospiria bacterium]
MSSDAPRPALALAKPEARFIYVGTRVATGLEIPHACHSIAKPEAVPL